MLGSRVGVGLHTPPPLENSKFLYLHNKITENMHRATWKTQYRSNTPPPPLKKNLDHAVYGQG